MRVFGGLGGQGLPGAGQEDGLGQPPRMARAGRPRRRSTPDSRWLFFAIHSEAPGAPVHGAAQHHIPDVHVPGSVCKVVLPQRSHLLRHQDRRIYPLQLRVCRRVHGAEVRVQRPRWNLSANTAACTYRKGGTCRRSDAGRATGLSDRRLCIPLLQT